MSFTRIGGAFLSAPTQHSSSSVSWLLVSIYAISDNNLDECRLQLPRYPVGRNVLIADIGRFLGMAAEVGRLCRYL